MSQMTAVNVIRIEKGKGQEVAGRFEKPKAVHTFEGFVRMEVWMKEDVEDHDELHICTTWEDEKYFEAWRKKRAVDKAQARAMQEQNPSVQPEQNPILGTELSTYLTLVQHLPAEKE
ncbi:hypothetical protein CSV61_08575 [Sporosarcina sp. P3]|uniref:antibiotic biosynthesis monooxygenase n=1 Tax=Sporosarcina sp. P3 TaxID=2048245 RepID=UPI000C164D4B|nr:antibiotic biosynthesis monooxygenase [Sporosarcina sp. P3]PID21745.1 hypothetical protein CSV61_08575 [Sporosarcina sp. P3]